MVVETKKKGSYEEWEGDLIKLAKKGTFDVIVHGCNCMCTQGAGLAKQMVEAFQTDKFKFENKDTKGDINKLGTINFREFVNINGVDFKEKLLTVVNAYTQYNYGKNHIDGDLRPLDYHALALCLKKINHIFKGKHIGLPQIGCDLAGGTWETVKMIIKDKLKDCQVTVVIYNPKK